VSKYEFIDSQKAEPANLNSVVKMCLWLAVSTSGFYDWATRPQSATAARRQALTARIQHYFEESEGTYGYRRLHADLAAEKTECSPELVRQIKRYQGLVACQPRPFRITTEADAEAAAGMPDLVKRDFTADRPGVKFVGDITYITPGKDSFTSPPSSTVTRRKSSAGPSPITCGLNSSPMRSRTPPLRP
jgi:putative transposase